MRTTIDTPDDLHAQVASIGRETGQSLGEVITWLVRRGLSSVSLQEEAMSVHPGLPVVYLGRAITPESVGQLDDDQ